MISMILIVSFRDVVSLLSFKVNQDYIANFLCINKDVPKSTCQGKCMLSKTIKEAHEQDENSKIPFVTENKQSLIFLISDGNRDYDFHLNFFKNNLSITNLHLVGNPYISDVFHPPQV